ncbi:MAG: carboxypeptidase-like regulatory domain-containing protein, partial [Ginsengibacter sp.]
MKSVYLKFLLLIGCFFIAASGWAQVKKVSGTVTDESNNHLSGVSIIIQGKTEGTQTIADGTYSIDVAPGDVLNFSFVGYSSQKVKVENSAIINVILHVSTDKLGEVVVVGYGTQNRSNVTTSISKLDNNVLASTPRANIGSALQGTISGLQVVNATGQPGASPVIILRGGASINNPGGPLVVIDGVIR